MGSWNHFQVSMWGDYGRMERKTFIGVAMISLDALNLTSDRGGVQVEGWYKLYQTNSLLGMSGNRCSSAMSHDEARFSRSFEEPAKFSENEI